MKVKGGIFAYLLILIGIVLGVALVLGAIMIISPGVEIFGLSYVSSNKSYNYVIDNGFADFNNYDTVILEVPYSNISVRVGTEQTAKSTVFVQNHIKGYVTAGGQYAGKLTYHIDGRTISFKVLEDKPWLPLGDSRKVEIRINENTDISNVNFILKTKNGSIDFGGGTIEQEPAMTLLAKSATLEAGKSIIVRDIADVSQTLSLKTTNDKITITGNKNASEVILETQKGKITTDNLNSTTLISNSGGAKLGDINGNLFYDSRSGVLEAGNINGSFIASSRVALSNITLKEVSGEVGLSKGEDINFKADKIGKFARIITNKGNIVIGNGEKSSGLASQAEISVNYGDMKVFVENKNTSSIELFSIKAHITAVFDGYKGERNIQTDNGEIDVLLKYDASLNIDLNSQGKAYLVYDDNKLLEKPDTTLEIRGGTAFDSKNVLTITANNNVTRIDRKASVVF